jgi:hypothetical protein
VDERREPPPKPVTRRPVISTRAKLSPLQQAWSRYVDHTTNCDGCRNIDSGRCEVSERLWNLYHAHTDEAYRRMSDGS